MIDAPVAPVVSRSFETLKCFGQAKQLYISGPTVTARQTGQDLVSSESKMRIYEVIYTKSEKENKPESKTVQVLSLG